MGGGEPCAAGKVTVRDDAVEITPHEIRYEQEQAPKLRSEGSGLKMERADIGRGIHDGFERRVAHAGGTPAECDDPMFLQRALHRRRARWRALP